MQNEKEKQAGLDFLRNTLHLAQALVKLIENQEEPYNDLTIRAIIEGDERFRGYHPVSLFAALQFIDELAQIIRPKRVAEMPAKEAWAWEMDRVIELIFLQSYKTEISERPLVADMSRRIVTIINEERRQYES